MAWVGYLTRGASLLLPILECMHSWGRVCHGRPSLVMSKTRAPEKDLLPPGLRMLSEQLSGLGPGLKATKRLIRRP
jgi:hypothetical protein